jgi:hypothetical protein
VRRVGVRPWRGLWRCQAPRRRPLWHGHPPKQARRVDGQSLPRLPRRVLKACEGLKSKMTAIAAHMLQTDLASVELTGGVFVAGEATLPFEAVAQAAYLHTFLLPQGMEMGLTADASYDPGNTSAFPGPDGKMNPAATYATAAMAVVVEVDPRTGAVAVVDAAMVHDCGNLINPDIVDGQVQGGFAQGVGAVLSEALIYDDNGQPMTTTLLETLTMDRITVTEGDTDRSVSAPTAPRPRKTIAGEDDHEHGPVCDDPTDLRPEVIGMLALIRRRGGCGAGIGGRRGRERTCSRSHPEM